MTNEFKQVLIWISGSFVAVLLALNFLPAAYDGNSYVPVGNDSFYHARRILDAVADPGHYYEFDPKIHAPEGSLLTWPWAYDLGVSYIVRGVLATGLARDPMAVLDFVPVAAAPIAIALMLAICVQLGMSLWSQFIAVLCVAMSTLTAGIFGVGMIDHHYVEYLFVLAALLTGMVWLRTPDSSIKAAGAAAVLAIAPAFQNGLFILQLPLLAAFAVLWWRGRPMPMRATLAFCASLVVLTLVMLWPSEPFREWRFAYWYFSWFHLAVAVCTAIMSYLMARLPRQMTSLYWMAGFAALVLLVAIEPLLESGSYFRASIERLYHVNEVVSVPEMVAASGILWAANIYSWLLLLLPLSFIVSVWMSWRANSTREQILLGAAGVMGLVFLLLKIRFHVIGSFALFLPLLVFVENLVRRYPPHRLRLMLLVSLVVVVSFAPALRAQFRIRHYLGEDIYYQLTRSIYPILADACRRQPGIVLAANNDGHYIRYHTDCSVIADNFMLTPGHVGKLSEMEQLLALTPHALLEVELPIRYVYVRSNLNIEIRGDDGISVVSEEDARRWARPLERDLLFTSLNQIDPHFRLLKELRWSGSTNYVYARLFEIVGTEAGPPSTPIPTP